MKELIIIGAGEFAEIAYEYFTHDSDYRVVAFSVEKDYIEKEKLYDLPVVPFEELETLYSPDKYKIFVAVTYTGLNRVRTILYEEAKKKGYSPASYVSSRAFVWDNTEIGENCFIFENCIIQHNAKIGNNVVLWSGAQILHGSIIKDNCFLSGNVGISGMCKIEENSFIGINSCVIDHLKIAKDCIIGAGAVVINDTEEGKIYVGNPAKPLKKSSLDTVFWNSDRIDSD